MTKLELDNVVLTVAGSALLRGVNLTLAAGEFVALMGPNGAGKSSLMKCALGAITPSCGSALIENENTSAIDPQRRARLISYLPQIRDTAWPITVRDIVALGRYAYGALSGSLAGDSKRAVENAIVACGLEALASRRADTLSGGELARAHCARAFAAEAPLLLADEPLTSLDPAGQVDILSLIRAHVDRGAGALVILHDINLAAAFADRIIWMKDGEIVADGTPEKTVAEDLVKEVFNIETMVENTPAGPRINFSRTRKI